VIVVCFISGFVFFRLVTINCLVIKYDCFVWNKILLSSNYNCFSYNQ